MAKWTPRFHQILAPLRGGADRFFIFLPDKLSSVPESNPNSEDESKSEDKSVAKKAENKVFVKNGCANLTG